MFPQRERVAAWGCVIEDNGATQRRRIDAKYSALWSMLACRNRTHVVGLPRAVFR